MLDTHQSDMGTKLVLTPNRSLSWTGNKWVIASLATLCLSIGIMMTVIHGAWVILPMAGMEILLFGSALFYVSRRLSYRQVICLQHQHIVIEKGYYRPRRHWRLPRHQVQLQIQPPQHDWEASSLALCCCRSERIESGELIGSREDIGDGEGSSSKECIDIGEFLSADDAAHLITILRDYLSRPQAPSYDE